MQLATVLLSASWMLAAGPSGATGLGNELEGLRSEAMGGAHRGLGTSNDTLMLNPAGMVMSRRYSVDLLYGFTSYDQLSHISVTAVDSKSGPVAGAVGYTHDRGDDSGVNASLHRIYMGVAYPIFKNFGFGITARNIRGEFNDASGERQEINAYTGDIGVAFRMAQGFGVGLTYHNVIRTDYPRLTPPGLGGGLSYSTGPFTVAADVYADMRREDDPLFKYHVGAEYFAAKQFPLRLGYRRQPFTHRNGSRRHENIVSGGVGWLSQGGALEATYSQSIERGRNWSVIGALKFFL